MKEDLAADAVVVGAGHNGLIAACYLARAGLRVVVVERRDVVGGAAVTEELIPGFCVSTASYSLSLLRPDIHADLELGSRGLDIMPKDPMQFVPLPDGRHYFVWRDAARTREELARIHPPDADSYVRWSSFWDEAVGLLRPLVDDPDPPDLQGVRKLLRDAGREDVWQLAVAGSAAETVEAFFEAPEVQGPFASQGIIGTWLGVRDPGTAWVLAYHALGGELAGATGTWAYVRGGMGALTQALAAAATGYGVEIITGAAVEEMLIQKGKASGVRLEDGRVIQADVVLSNADPKTTFAHLIPQGVLDAAFTRRVDAWRTPGCVVKLNMALEELPDLTALPGTTSGPQHAGTISIAPSIDYLQRAFDDAAAGRPSAGPFMEVFVQSAVDPSLAPEGRHVLSAFTQYAPPQTEWSRVADHAEAAILSTLSSYAPNIPDAILAMELFGPPDLEARFGMSGGNIFHGELVPEQCFGDRFAYRTPVRGLYLCGSGARPGGCVMGAPGRNAASTVLHDRRQGGRRPT